MGKQRPLPSMKGAEMHRLLVKLCGPPTRWSGSHRTFQPPGGDGFAFGFSKHDGEELAPGLVRRILVNDVGLTLEQAERAVRKGKL